MSATTARADLNWDVLVTNRQGLTRDLPPGKEQWTWVPTSATLIFGQRDAVLVDAFLTIEQAAVLVEWVAANGKLPVPNFSAGGIATPADAALVMQLGAESVFVGSGIFKSSDPAQRARAIVKATTHFKDAKAVLEASEELGEAMPGLDVRQMDEKDLLQTRGW